MTPTNQTQRVRVQFIEVFVADDGKEINVFGNIETGFLYSQQKDKSTTFGFTYVYIKENFSNFQKFDAEVFKKFLTDYAH